MKLRDARPSAQSATVTDRRYKKLKLARAQHDQGAAFDHFDVLRARLFG